MGIVFPTIPLSVMGIVEEGREAGELSSTILMDYLGVGIGAGLGGASVALADDRTISIEAGLAGAFGAPARGRGLGVPRESPFQGIQPCPPTGRYPSAWNDLQRPHPSSGAFA